jgi:hypothetical protein
MCPATVKNMALPRLVDLLAAHAQTQNGKFFESNGKLKVVLDGNTRDRAVEVRVAPHGRMADCMKSPFNPRAFSAAYLECFRDWEAGMDGIFFQSLYDGLKGLHDARKQQQKNNRVSCRCSC